MSDTAEDAQLLADVAAGDQRAAAVLYDIYAPILYGYGLHRLRDRELAEELVQQVLWKLCRRAGHYDPARGPVRAYVFAIAGSTVIDFQRQAPNRPTPVGVVEAGTPLTGTAVTDTADRVVAAATVRAALQRLGEDHRRVLELAYDRGMTQREIAQVLALPLGTVKSRTYYALQAFRLACEELGVKP